MKRRNKIPPTAKETDGTLPKVPLPALSHAGPCRNPECVMCPEWREKLGRKAQTEVYSVRGSVRYCKCLICNHTWKFSE